MKKVLIVDDDKDLREVIDTVLSGSYQVKEAGGKQEAFDILDKYMPDIIILDVMMDTISTGFEIARELKEQVKYKHIKILMLTNIDNEMQIDYKAESGNAEWLPVDDYLIKPIEPKLLLQKVANLTA